MEGNSDQTQRTEISSELFAELWRRRYDLLFKAWVQVRYHRRRQRFFDLVDKSTKSTTLILGATLFGKHLGSLNWVATGISALGLMALVFGYGDRKQLHKELAESAANLVASIEGIPSSLLSEEKVARWAEDYARICGKAPPPLKTLTIICEHEQSVVDCSNKKINADGKEEELIKLPWLWRRCLSQLKS